MPQQNSQRLLPLICLPLLWIGNVYAQAPVERYKLTDNDLSCQQLLDERTAMDNEIAAAKQAQSSGQTTAVAGQAAGVAAEVASRSGLFGSLGGMAGHLFGSAASKAAANATEQQGTQSAAQAAAREKAASERKEHLTQRYLSKNCSGGDTSATPPARSATTGAAAVPVPPPSFTAPNLSVINGDRLKGIRRVAVASFTVQFAESQVGEVTTTNKIQSAGAVGITQVTSRVVGVDFRHALARERMQESTNALYRDFLTQLQAAGLDVVQPAQLQAQEHFRRYAARGAAAPREEDAEAQKGSGQGAIRSVFMSPAGLPLIIKAGSGSESIDWLNKGDSSFSPTVVDHTLTFTGQLALYSSSFYDYERDLRQALDAATLHVRVFVPLAIIEVDQGMNWSKAKIEPGVLLGKRFTRMTVGTPDGYAYLFLKDDFKVPGVITYTVEESPHPNPLRAALGEKTRTFPSTMNVDNYWRDVPAASRHVFSTFIDTLNQRRL